MIKDAFKISTLALATSAALIMTGCGGGDDSDNGSHEPVQASGQFIDAAVANLDVYQNGKKVATTDSEGTFTYMTGSEVTFKLGQLTLGSTMPKAIVTPADLASNSADVIEILQVLQSLDEDNNPDNGIFIPQPMIDKLVTALDLSDDDVSIADTVKKDIPELVLVAKEKALEHFNKAQQTVKSSEELSKVADEFVGYWQQSCENGHQQVFQLVKDSSADNTLVQTGQYLDRSYENEDCTGSYEETIKHSDNDSLAVQIMGTSRNEDDKKVVNAIRQEGSNTFIDNLVMLSDDAYSGGELTFSRNQNLSFDDAPVDTKVEILKGYWKSECIQSTNGSKIYYLNNVLQGNGSLFIKQSLREDFSTKNCSGASEISINENNSGIVVPQTDIDNAKLNGNNQFIATGHTVETYNRINEAEFPEVSVAHAIKTPEQVASALTGYWKSECLNRSDDVDGAKSLIDYFYSVKHSNDTINVEKSAYQYFSGNNCTGTIVDTAHENYSELHTFSNPQQESDNLWSFDVTNSDDSRMKFITPDSIVFSNDGERYHRSTKSEFENVSK